MSRRLWRWLLSGVGVLCLAALVFVFAAFIPLFEPVWPRAVLVLLMVVAWLVTNLLLDRRARRRNAVLDAALLPDAKTMVPDASAEEVAALRERMAQALGLLKRARGTRGYLYEQPWYVIIGPPGAGKTTALINSGLRFPLAAEMGQSAVAGIGGTRLCDWWFTEEAVLIDTAGRYTTQDSDARVDAAGWHGFLDMLRRARPREPLNGVIVAMAASDLVTATGDEVTEQARAVRRRVRELEERLGLRLPVYMLFTKADLIAGFVEYFDDLDQERRGQVWGVTFPAPGKGGDATGAVAQFGSGFGALLARLSERLFDRLQTERGPDRRALIAGFPAQVASLQAPFETFLHEAFGGSRLDPAPMLRGVYLTSGTQEGTPFDRLTGVLARSFGLDQQRVPSLRPERGRSYFLGRLLREVIFREARLATEPPGTARRRLALRAASFAGALILLLVLGGLVLSERASSMQQVASVESAFATYASHASKFPFDPVNDGDLMRVLPLLDEARALPDSTPSGSGLLGLGQGSKLRAGGGVVYHRALERLLLPRLIWRLEAQMRGNLQRPDYLYEATRVYLMLGSAGPLDSALMRAWMRLDWQNAYPGAAAAPARDEMAKHLDALLADPLPQIGLDGALVAQARAAFSRIPLATRVYSRIKPSAAAQRVPAWAPASALDAAGVRLFVRGSGKPLTDGVPGFFTPAGFTTVLIPALGSVVREVAQESWVLGERAQLDPASPAVRSLERDVIHAYEDDYIAAWNGLLGDLNLVPLRNMAQASTDLYLLGSPQSPVHDLLAAIAKNLTLASTPATPAAGNSLTAPVAAAEQRVGQIIGVATGQSADSAPGSRVDAAFKPLRDYVGSGPAAPLNAAIQAIAALQAQLGRVGAAPVPGAPPVAAAGDDPVILLKTEAVRAPQPVGRWLNAMASDGVALRTGGIRGQVSSAYNGSDGPAQLCRQAVPGRFPFVAGAAADIPLDDFAKLFAPGGQLDSFFNTQLRPYADTSTKPWRAQALPNGLPPPINAADLAQFERAAAIRDMFFPSGNTPAVRFDVRVADADRGTRQVTLDIEGAQTVFTFGPEVWTTITWPNPGHSGMARLAFDPPPSGAPAALNGNGPWSVFHLFAQGTLKRGPTPELYTLDFASGERRATLQVRAGSVNNPFASGPLQEFRCPDMQ